MRFAAVLAGIPKLAPPIKQAPVAPSGPWGRRGRRRRRASIGGDCRVRRRGGAHEAPPREPALKGGSYPARLAVSRSKQRVPRCPVGKHAACPAAWASPRPSSSIGHWSLLVRYWVLDFTLRPLGGPRALSWANPGPRRLLFAPIRPRGTPGQPTPFLRRPTTRATAFGVRRPGAAFDLAAADSSTAVRPSILRGAPARTLLDWPLIIPCSLLGIRLLPIHLIHPPPGGERL